MTSMRPNTPHAAGFTLIEKDGRPVLLGPHGKPIEITIPLAGKASMNAVDQKIVAVLKEDWEGNSHKRSLTPPGGRLSLSGLDRKDCCSLRWHARTPGTKTSTVWTISKRSPLGEKLLPLRQRHVHSLIHAT